MRTCGNCEYNDGCVYTSLPPKFKCTITGKFHFGIKPCSVEFAPVRHGRWVVDPEGMLHCSNCKEIPTNRIVVNADLIYDMTPIKEKMKYCPKCGAKMGEEE